MNGSSGGSRKKKPEPVSLIDFDFDEEPASSSAAAATARSQAPSNPMDDLSALSGLSLGGGGVDSQFTATSTSSRPPTQHKVDPMSLFANLDFSSSSSPASASSSPANGVARATPAVQRPPQQQMSGASGAFFSNPAYGQRQAAASNTGWGMMGSGSGSGSGSSTPLSPTGGGGGGGGGAISLGAGGGAGNSSTSRPSSAMAMATAYSPPLPQLPSSGGFAGSGRPPAPPPKKDAFEDLLGDF